MNMKRTFILLLVVVIGVSIFAVGRCYDFTGLSKDGKEGASDINWQYAYDERGRVKEMISPGKRMVSFAYEDDAQTGLGKGMGHIFILDILKA